MQPNKSRLVQRSPKSVQPPATSKIKASDQLPLQRRERRLARYEQVRELRHRGIGVTAIARTMKLNRRTVYGWLRADTFPERAPRSSAQSKLDSYMPYLYQRWQQGCHNAAALTREIRAKGYQGGRALKLIHLYMSHLKNAAACYGSKMLQYKSGYYRTCGAYNL